MFLPHSLRPALQVCLTLRFFSPLFTFFLLPFLLLFASGSSSGFKPSFQKFLLFLLFQTFFVKLMVELVSFAIIVKYKWIYFSIRNIYKRKRGFFLQGQRN